MGINTETHKHAMDTADHMTSTVDRITNQISITVMSPDQYELMEALSSSPE